MSVCYAVASGKGGVGKSTITAGLGAAIARSGSRVLIIDADIGLRSQDAILSLENRVVYDLIDLAEGDCTLDQAVLPSDAVRGLFLLPAAQFSRAKKLDPDRFAKILRSLRQSYDYIFIDCPAGVERGLRNVLNAGVDEEILIATPDDISVRSAERTWQVMESKKLNRPWLIVNRLDEELVRSAGMMSARTVSEVLDLPLLGEIPDDPVVLRAALKHALFMDYDCEARNAVMRIASRLSGRSVPFPGYGTQKQSWIRRLFSRPLKEVSPIDDH
ncbi:MAG: septum site-determining protein MinD [Clostridia bacterium]|nr:septum site-determining protein MinD [Clostridia bacterium]